MSYQEDRLTEIADAIRSVKGTTEPIKAEDFAEEILSAYENIATIVIVGGYNYVDTKFRVSHRRDNIELYSRVMSIGKPTPRQWVGYIRNVELGDIIRIRQTQGSGTMNGRHLYPITPTSSDTKSSFFTTEYSKDVDIELKTSINTIYITNVSV